MTERVRYRPFTGDDQTRIRLQSAPLEMVLCQIRWPELSYLQESRLQPLARDFGARLVDYPLYGETPELGFMVGPSGVEQKELGTVYRWSSVDQTKHVNLGRTFLSVFSRDYQGWDGFVEELEAVLSCLQASIDPKIIERVGVRYLNRISDQDVMERIEDLVKPQVLGYQGLSLPNATGVRLVQAVNQVEYEVDHATLQVRSGVVPAGQTVDSSVAPVDGPSWILDLDATSPVNAAFDTADAVARAGRMSDVAYDFFKYAISNGFVDHFGRRTD